MRVQIVHRGPKPWRPPGNHLDGRVCPDCFTTVHGPDAQTSHQAWHLQLNTLAQELARRTGIQGNEFDDEWSWGAEVTGTEDGDEIEASDDERLQARIQRGAQSHVHAGSGGRAGGCGAEAG